MRQRPHAWLQHPAWYTKPVGVLLNLVGVERDEIVAVFSLKAAIGQLTARHLNLPIEYYDTGRHYREVRDKWVGTDKYNEIEEKEKYKTGEK